MPLRLITAPANDPVTLARIKANTRLEVDFTDHDDLLNVLQRTAVNEFQHRTSRQLVPATWELVLPVLSNVVKIMKCPVMEVTSVKYYDTDNAEQTMEVDTDYDINLLNEPAIIRFLQMPATYDRPDAVVIRFRAGYASVPEDIQDAIMAYVTTRYDNPGNTVQTMPTFFSELIKQHRVWPQR